MAAIYKREMQSYFHTVLGYAFLAMFMLLTGIFFTINNILLGSAGFAPVLSSVTYLMMLLVPILTMRTFAEERKTKTEQLLLSSPVKMLSIVAGKFLAALTCLLAALVLTAFYPFILCLLGDPSLGEMLSGYLGSLLIGAALIALGLFISSLSSNQIVAVLTTMGTFLMLWMLDRSISSISYGIARSLVVWVSPFTNIASFKNGLITSTSVTYLVTFTVFFFFATVFALERRRWR